MRPKSQGDLLCSNVFLHPYRAVSVCLGDKISLSGHARGDGPQTGAVLFRADYNQLGIQVIAVAVLTVVLPLTPIFLVQS